MHEKIRRIQNVGEENMEATSNVTLSALSSYRKMLDVVTNNIANMNTVGYQSEQPIFKEYLDESQKTSYVENYGTWRDLGEGAMQTTGSNFDFALRGEGYFVVNTNNGPKYTRNGHFQLDAEGRMVTDQGDFVQGEGGNIQIGLDETNIKVGKDGTISSEGGILGKLQIVTFNERQNLVKEGNSYYDANGQAPVASNNVSVLQGYVEGSNVNSVTEMTKLIQLSRQYMSTNKMLQEEYKRIESYIDEMTPDI